MFIVADLVSLSTQKKERETKLIAAWVKDLKFN